MHKLLPFIEVLPKIVREVNLTRKNRLNPWERESARTTGSKRSENFRKKVISYYGRVSPSKKDVKCQVLDILTPIKEAQDKIIAAHIWKASTRGKGLEEFGLILSGSQIDKIDNDQAADIPETHLACYFSGGFHVD